MATLLDRLGEGPSSAEHELSRPTGALITPESGDPTYKDTGSSVAPIIVIRDLASDPGIKPSTDMGCLGALLDDLIAPDLALTFITMYVIPRVTLKPPRVLILSDLNPVFSSTMAAGFSSTQKATRPLFYPA